MNLGLALFIWLIIVLVVFFLAKRYHIATFSAIILALLIGAIVLGIIRPVTTVDMVMNGLSGLNAVYYLIMGLTSLLILIYVVWKAVTDVQQPTTSYLATSVMAKAPCDLE
jgi:hypothetical protein